MYCYKCGAENPDNAVYCVRCNEFIQPAANAYPADDPALRLLVPIGVSGWAIAAGYAGLFAVLLVPAPIALVLGIVAWRDIKLHPEKHGRYRAIFAMTMGVIFTLGLIVLAIGMLTHKV